jgi:hypothetical protein
MIYGCWILLLQNLYVMFVMSWAFLPLTFRSLKKMCRVSASWLSSYKSTIIFIEHKLLYIEFVNPARLPVRPFVRLSVCPFVRLSVCPFVPLFVCLSVRLSVCLSVRLSARPSVCPSVCPPVCSSICLSVCASVRLSVRLYPIFSPSFNLRS